jgi:ElaB/YqjD/DUF883 family membrane-anchored ribosome-binding protein
MNAAKGKYAGSEFNEEFASAKQAAVEAYANFLDARNHLKAAALAAGMEFRDTANEQFEEALERIIEQKDQVYETTWDFMRENPVTSAGIAFVGGLLFSRLLDR